MINGKPLIGIITARASQAEQRQQLMGILTAAERLGAYTAVFTNLYNFDTYHADSEVENKIYELIESRRIDGLILTAESILNSGLQQYIYGQFYGKGIPVVVTGAVLEGFTCINNDVRADLQDIARHLVEVHGFTDIDVLTGDAGYETSDERVEGVRDVFRKKGLPFGDDRVIYGDYWMTSGAALAEDYTSGKRRMPQAVICANDYMAYGLIDRFFEKGVRLPDDITVVGYEYVGERYYHSPVLTTYKRNRYAVGEKAMETVYSLITGNKPRALSLKGCMVCGDTCPCRADMSYLGEELNSIRDEKYYTGLNLCGNFEQQLTCCRSIADYIRVLQEFAYLIRNLEGLYVCLYENWCSLSEKSDLGSSSNNETMICYRVISPRQASSEPHIFTRKDLCPEKLPGAGDDMFLYFMPMFSAGVEIGHFIFQYASPDVFDGIAINWINSAVNALMALRMKNDISELLEYNDLSAFHDTVTGLYNRAGLEAELAGALKKADSGSDLSAVMIKTEPFADNSRLDSKSLSVRLASETAECIKKIAAESGSYCARLSDKTFVYVIIGELPDNYHEMIADRLSVMISHSPLFSENCDCDSIVFAGMTAAAGEYTVDRLLTELSAGTDLRTKELSDRRKRADYGEYNAVRTMIYHAPEKRWDARMTCKDFCLSYGHFRAEYKEIFGTSFHRDLIHSRISTAKYLLMTTALSLPAIAVKCGYDDDKYFLRQFRQITGMTPNSYRRFGTTDTTEQA